VLFVETLGKAQHQSGAFVRRKGQGLDGDRFGGGAHLEQSSRVVEI
jgi:hypothetical protein